VQQINVGDFDSNLGSDWENIVQPNTGQKLHGISQILMHRAQYRNFGTSQNIVCNHTVDVDNSNHAGVRWYELKHNGTDWEVRQYGTYAPDGDSRWMGSIAMNSNREIALGYSVSSSSTYPSIRYAGQSNAENASATGILDITEASIHEGTASQTSSERWGDYSNMAIDAANDQTFWFTTEYNINGALKGTKIASFEFSLLPHAEFVADNLIPGLTDIVTFTDLTTGSPISWSWSFTPSTVTYMNGTSATSQDPEVRFDVIGFYTVELTATNAIGPDTETKVDYIAAGNPPVPPIANFVASNTNPTTEDTVFFTDLTMNDPTSWAWTFTPSTVTYLNGTSATSQNPDVMFDVSGSYTVKLTATNAVGSDTEIKVDYIAVDDPPLAPEADFVASNTNPTTLDAVLFTDLTINDPTSWAWTFTPSTVTYLNGTSATSQDPNVRFDEAGLYTAELTATNNAGSDTETKTDYISVTVGMLVMASADPGEICEGFSTQLNAIPLGGSGSYTYNWTSDPAGFTSTLQNPVAMPVVNTLYMVELFDGSLTANGAVSVIVNPLPVITLGEWPEMLCNVGVPPVQLTALPGGGIFSGTGVAATGLFISSTAELGWNVITYTYEDAIGCINSAQDSIYVDDCVGITEISADESTVNIYPNPSMGSFTLESENNIEKIEIINQNGKMVMMRKINGTSTAISALRSKGLYYVRVYTTGQDAKTTVVNKEIIIR
jgi:PKD repeat protein